MSDTGFTIDAEAFGLPTGVNGDSTPGFMYGAGDDDLGVDVNDPIYAATVQAMKARGIDIPAPGTEPRPPAMPTEGDGETPIGGTPPAPPSGPDADTIRQAMEGDEPPLQPGDEPRVETPPETPPVEPAAPAPDGTDQTADDDTDDDETPADALAFQVDGQDFTLDTQQAEYLIRVNSWLEQIPDETKQQWAAIEQGTAVAISAEEYAALKAAAQSPRPAQQQSNQPRVPDLDDLDDDTIEYIRSLEARVTPAADGPAPDGPPSQQPQQQPDPMEIAAAARHQAEQQQQFLSDLRATNENYAEQYGLTEDQMGRLAEVTANLQVIPGISRSLTHYSPTGQVIRQAPVEEVFTQAYDIAMGSDPTLRAVRDEMIYNQRVAADAQRNAATNAKKAKAGTLASSPSAAVPAGGQGPQISPDNKMDLQGTSAAIAKALAEMSEQS